jgi:hypothetical protein
MKVLHSGFCTGQMIVSVCTVMVKVSTLCLHSEFVRFLHFACTACLCGFYTLPAQGVYAVSTLCLHRVFVRFL